MEIGQYLKRERELRAVSLSRVAEITKISPHYLVAIEAGDMSQLPGEVFLRGFIKSYAKVVGLSPEDVILRYDDIVKARIPLQPKTVIKEPSRIVVSRKTDKIVFAVIAAIVTLLAVFLSL